MLTTGKMMMKSDKMNNIRKSNMEMLRLLMAFGVVILHCNGYIGNGLDKVILGSYNAYWFVFLEVFFIVAVNVFILLFGYFQCNTSKVSIIKPVYLVTVVIFYRILIYFVNFIMGMQEFSVSYLISRFIPVNYYVILYCCLYLISPYINKVLKSLGISEWKKFLFIIFLLFSVWPSFVDWIQNISGFDLAGLSSIGVDGSQSGYTIVNFILLYIIGGSIWYLRNEQNRFSIIKCIFIEIVCIGILFVWKYLTMMYSLNTSVLDYCNPLVIISSIMIFLIFEKIEMKPNKVINELSRATLTIYLTHPFFLQIFVKYFNVNDSIASISGVIICLIVCIFGYICYKVFEVPLKIVKKIEEKLLSYIKI